jgi:hypothetical protein
MYLSRRRLSKENAFFSSKNAFRRGMGILPMSGAHPFDFTQGAFAGARGVRGRDARATFTDPVRGTVSSSTRPPAGPGARTAV